MFRLMLNAHSRLSVPLETWFLSDLMDRLPPDRPLTSEQVETALSIVKGHWRWKEWGLDDAQLQNALRALQTPALADVIDAIFSLTTRERPGARWGDKTPGYITEIERLHNVFPHAQFIHIIRDGRDVCLSLKKTGWHGNSTWEIAEYWGRAVSTAREAGQALPADQYLEVRYEQLVLDTERVLRSVCHFLGFDFEHAMLDFYETADEHVPDRARGHLSKTYRPPRATDVQRWTREQKRRQTVIFEAFAGPVLEAAGYDRTARRGLRAIRAVCRAVDLVATGTLPLRRKLGIHFPGWRKAL